MTGLPLASAARRRLAWLLLLALLAPVTIVHAEARVLIRFSHVVAEETPKGLAANRFKALVEQRSDGRIRVDIYPGASRYNDNDEMEALRLGAVEMLAPSLSKFGRIGFPEFELFDLPFLFDSIEDVRRISQGPIGRRLLVQLGRQGLVGLGYFDNGFKQMSANRPLLEPTDFLGLRMRVQSSRVIAAQFRVLGARPVSLPFSETRRALATGVVEGTENPVSNFWTQRMDQYQTDLTLSRHGYIGYAVVANRRFWQSLSDADREVVSSALRDALDFGNRIAGTQNEKALEELRQAGTTRIHTLSPAQRARLRQAVQPVYDELAGRIDAALVQEVQETLRP
ncbi:MAG: TRAP transporter substrate-binding protein [Burkholderiaceae bacterium]|nr:TRAP transporter substrate-binding protein [Burkholderiaceae bacterium]